MVKSFNLLKPYQTQVGGLSKPIANVLWSGISSPDGFHTEVGYFLYYKIFSDISIFQKFCCKNVFMKKIPTKINLNDNRTQIAGEKSDYITLTLWNLGYDQNEYLLV